jgi:hypothetical protein
MRPIAHLVVLTVFGFLLSACGPVLVNDQGFSKTCTVDTDCVPVYFGDVCGVCTCATAAIAKTSQASYERQVTNAKNLCGPRQAVGCDCVSSQAVCTAGQCVLTRP